MSHGDDETQCSKVSESQSSKVAELQSPKVAKPQGPNDSVTQGPNDSVTQGLKDSRTQSLKASVSQGPKIIPKLVGSVSIKAATANIVAPQPHLQAEVKPLTQEDLERYWKETAAELHLEEVMKNATVRIGEHIGRFEVDATTTYFADEFREHKIDVLESLRKKTGMKLLDCRVNPLFVEQNEKVYSPDDKYNAMLKENQHLALLRKLFPEIDY